MSPNVPIDAHPSPSAPAPPLGSVLVMDDDKYICILATSMLQCIGYQATTCMNGEEAIELYRDARASGHPYLTIIMDLEVLGGMGGKDAARQILRLDPQAKLVVSSGYSDDPIMANHRAYGFHTALPKPYSLRDVVEMLSRLQ